MLSEIIKYSLQDYIRSQKYFPPLSTFIILVLVYYAYKPNPIIDSYAVTGLMVYVISAWICIHIFSLDPPVQRKLMILHIGGNNRYYLAKIVTAWIISTIFTVYAFLFPIVFGMFNESVSFTIGIISWLNLLSLATLGISVALFFSTILMKSVVNSYGGLALIITLSLAMLGIYEVLPESIRGIVWIIPPATVTQKPLINWSGESLMNLELLPFMWVWLYSIILIAIFLFIVRRKS